MENRNDKSLRCALLKPGARIRRTLYRKYKEDENNNKNEEKRLSFGSGGGYCRTSSESVKSSVILQPSEKYDQKSQVSKKFITLDWKKDACSIEEPKSIVSTFNKKLEQPCSKIIRHPRGPGNNRVGFSLQRSTVVC